MILVAPSDINVAGNPPNSILVAGTNLALTCEMKGTPRPFIYWVLNGRFVTYDSIRKIFNGTRLNIAREEIHFSRIDFRPLRRFDGGEYTCFGSNYGGVIERKYSLDVDCKYCPSIFFAVFTSFVRSLQGWVHTAPVTNLSIFVDIC